RWCFCFMANLLRGCACPLERSKGRWLMSRKYVLDFVVRIEYTRFTCKMQVMSIRAAKAMGSDIPCRCLVTLTESLACSGRHTLRGLKRTLMTTSQTIVEDTAVPPRAGRREWIGLAVLALPCLIVVMDLTVLHLAVPTLTAALKPSPSQLLWIVDIYG